MLDVRALELAQELPRVRAQRLDVAALPLGVERVERQARLARAAHPREHHELALRAPEPIDAQVVLPRPEHLDEIRLARRVEELERRPVSSAGSGARRRRPARRAPEEPPFPGFAHRRARDGDSMDCGCGSVRSRAHRDSPPAINTVARSALGTLCPMEKHRRAERNAARAAHRSERQGGRADQRLVGAAGRSAPAHDNAGDVIGATVLVGTLDETGRDLGQIGVRRQDTCDISGAGTTPDRPSEQSSRTSPPRWRRSASPRRPPRRCRGRG